MKFNIILLLITAIFFSCGSRQVTDNRYPVAAQVGAGNTVNEPITESLFNDKNATISEESIKKILDGTLQLPQQLRIAIVNVNSSTSNRRYYWNDEQYLKTQQAYLDLFTLHLNKSQRVTTIHTIPDLLLAKPYSFTNIRESAVRLQADVVLLYSISTDIYSKYKLFTKSDIKSFATTQIVLLDVRTGLIPFSTIVTKDYLSTRQSTDLDYSDATNRIQKEAVLLTIEEIGKKVNIFLSNK
jgi:hypothetical protein